MPMNRLAAMVFAALVFLPPLAIAKDTDVFQQPGDFSIKTRTVQPNGQPAEYGASGTAPNWAIAQWGAPNKLPPFTVTQQGDDTISSSASPGASVVVKRGPEGTESYTLSQNGAVLPCETASGSPREFDLFASPDVNARPSGGISAYHVRSNGIALSAMSHLRVRATVSMHYTDISVPKSCGVSQGSVLISVILNDLISHQTLFYQLGLGSLCGPQPAARMAFCLDAQTHPRSNFFFKTNPFGVDDALPLLGRPWMKNGETRTINVDILPRLIHFVETGPPGMDHDPAHWVLGSYYNGQHIWGDVSLTTVWQNVGMTISTP